jgi:hypothetical protein
MTPRRDFLATLGEDDRRRGRRGPALLGARGLTTADRAGFRRRGEARLHSPAVAGCLLDMAHYAQAGGAPAQAVRAHQSSWY